MSFMATVWRKWVNLWEATQVELHGHYSVDHLHAFARYQASTSWRRACFVCALAPLPCVLMILMVDMIPLEPTTHGALGSPRVWLRNCITVFQLAVCNLEQIRTHLPKLELQRWEMLPIGLTSMAVSVGSTFAMAIAIGYPLPFAFIIGTVPWAIVIMGMIWAFKRRQLREHARLWHDVRLYLIVCACQVGMTVVYPIFNYVYTSLTSNQQTLSVLLLPLIKIAAKNGISRALPGTDDAKPEAVVFNVEIFHALFVSLIMGNTTSQRTVFLLMFIDLFQAWLSFRDLDEILKDAMAIQLKLKMTNSEATDNGDATSDLVNLASRIAVMDSFQAWGATKPLDSGKALASGFRFWGPQFALLQKTQVVPISALPRTPSVKDVRIGSRTWVTTKSSERQQSAIRLNAIDREALVRRTVKALYVCEFVVLVEYVEVIMPMIYNVYVVAMFFLPNRSYYPFLKRIHSSSDIFPTVANVLLYATLEFASLGLLAIILWRKWRISVLHQLAFVLEGRASNIQAKLFHWVLDIIQTSIVQIGNDYSFRFEWLKK